MDKLHRQIEVYLEQMSRTTLEGSPIPLPYGNFDLSAFFYFRQGHMIRSSFHQGNANGQFRYNHLDVDYWTPTNPTNDYPRPNFTQERPENGSTLEYFDGSYVKLRNVTLGYNFESRYSFKIRYDKSSCICTRAKPLV